MTNDEASAPLRKGDGSNPAPLSSHQRWEKDIKRARREREGGRDGGWDRDGGRDGGRRHFGASAVTMTEC